MSKFKAFVLFCAMVCFFCSCDHADKKLAIQSQRLVDEADVYLDHHDYPSALEKAQEAHRNLEILVQKHPDDADYVLLYARANLTLFLIENEEILRNATMDPENLIRIPDLDKYVGYGTYLSPLLYRLPIIAKNVDLDYSQQASLHTLLASIYRLNKGTLAEAIKEYEQAIQINRMWITDLESGKTPIKPNVYSIAQIKNQIRNLRLALAEVYLLDKNWNSSLTVLKQIMGGSDLEYFRIHFALLNEEIQSLNSKIASKKADNSTKEDKLFNFFNAKRENPSPLAELSSKSVDEIARMQAEINLVSLQNNLIYRMICYYNLNDMQNFNAAHTILKEAYPEIDKQVVDMLKGQQKS